MERRSGLSAGQVVVIVVACVIAAIVGIAFLAAVLVPTLQQANELTNRTVCMSSLSCIGKALVLYRGTNEDQWPWLSDRLTGWDTNPVGLNRGKDPFGDPNDPGTRSVTSLMFLLVREGQPVKLFICPSTTDFKDEHIMDPNARGDEEPEFFWDFTSAENVSYSWQAPIKDANGNYRNGVTSDSDDVVLASDRTPAADPRVDWRNGDWDPKLTGAKMEPHVGPNHRGKQVNVLLVGMNVAKSDRPDIGQQGDMIFTASGQRTGGSRSATSISISDHLSTGDSFLIGPISDGSGDAD